MADEQNELVNEEIQPVEETAAETTPGITEENVSDAIEALLAGDSSDSDETGDEGSTEEQSAEITPEPQDNTEAQPEQKSALPTITEDMAAENPVLKPYIGKEVSEVFKALREAVSWGTKLSQENSELKKGRKPEAHAQETQEATPEVVDPLTMEPEDFNRYIQAEIDRRVEAMLADKLKPLVEMEQAQRAVEAQRAQEQILKDIQSKLPENVSAQEVIAEFVQAAGELFTSPEEMQQFYTRNLKKFEADVISFGQAKASQKSQAQLSASRKKAIATEVSNAISRTNTARQASSTPGSRETKSLSAEEKLLLEITGNIHN